LETIGSVSASKIVVQNGAALAVTLMEPGVVTAAVLVSEMPVISTSTDGVDDKDGPD